MGLSVNFLEADYECVTRRTTARAGRTARRMNEAFMFGLLIYSLEFCEVEVRMKRWVEMVSRGIYRWVMRCGVERMQPRFRLGTG